MATPQLSPGVLIREVDLTVGRADNVLDNIGAIAGPFPIGPVDEAVDIVTEQELISEFGKPISSDAQYEYWLTASSFLSYGGILKVVRTDGDTLVNANAIRNSSGVSTAGEPTLKIKNITDYEVTRSEEGQAGNYIFAAKTPGSWANDLKVAMIDNKADQILSVGAGFTDSAETWIGYGVTTALTNVVYAGSGTTETFSGYLKGIITGINTESSTFDVKIISLVDTNDVETIVDYSQRSDLTSFRPGDELSVTNSSGVSVATTTLDSTATSVLDWYDEQVIDLQGTDIFWKSIAPKPGTTGYGEGRNCRNDELHVVVYDDSGSITGINGNLLEKHIGLSKAFDAVSEVNSPQRNWWKGYIANFSQYLYAGVNPSSSAVDDEVAYATGFSSGFTPYTDTEGLWNQQALNTTFSAAGNVTYTLSGGSDYTGGGMKATLGDLTTSYRLFEEPDNIQVDYLLGGPSLDTLAESQAKANYLISLATTRKDCIATISPHREGVINITNTDTQTDNVIEFFSPLSSSSYAVFDTGWKFMYDRFNNRFRYVPCNGDIAGLMVRTSVFAVPWFSPAGAQRGVLNNAVKLAFSPNKAQQDRLYPARINSIVNKPGVGIMLNGDKTALGYASALDRINVRRLFLTVEQALKRTAQSVLFEINDEITRANFVNVVEPYLRDVEARRGLYGFLVVCDESNNTPDIIDNNEFRADIYLKPTKSINYVQLTFVATRTGTSFEEVAGTV